ncbi:MAG: sodium:solute symporter family protein [Hyphomicrobiales bacterium]|nr:sodium:solute symporter family protein [Hyphomicrobiales bacterium]
MAAPASTDKGDFVNNLRKIYGIYTGGFFGFVIILAIAEQLGVPNQYIGYAFVCLTIVVYAFIGIVTRTTQVSEYYVAGRKVPAFYNGMATGADWMSAASFVGMAGTLFLLGYDGLAFVLGWTGGFVLVALFVAPYLRKFGAYTVPDFLSARFGGNFARFLGVVVLAACSFTYVTAQIYGTGLIAQRFLGMDFQIAVYVGLLGILLCSMLGGMRAVTWTQVAQYIVLIVAYLTPVVILSTQKFGLPFPQLTYGSAIQEITALEQSMIQQGLATAASLKPHIQPFTSYSPLNYFGLILCLMVGTASLPHVLMRYFTTPSVREARVSVAWSLFFIFLLYFTAPAYAAFSKLEVYNLISNGGAGTAFAVLPDWIETYSKLNLVNIHGISLQTFYDVINVVKGGAVDTAGVAAQLKATGAETAGGFAAMKEPAKAAMLEAARANVGSSPDQIWDAFRTAVLPAVAQAAGNTKGLLLHSALAINPDVIVLSTPEIAGMPYVIAGLVAAGGLAAALSTADGLLLAIANALSHDVYYKMIDPKAPASRRLIVARVLLVIVAVAAAYTASTKPADILAMVAWAFSLAAAGLFPVLVMGIWWKRANSLGAVMGMILGFGITLTYLVVTRYYPQFGIEYLGMYANLKPSDFTPVVDIAKIQADAAVWNVSPVPASHPLAGKVGWFNVNNISSALFGMPLGFLSIIVFSMLTPRPSQAMYDFLDKVRRPRGGTILEEKDTVVA